MFFAVGRTSSSSLSSWGRREKNKSKWNVGLVGPAKTKCVTNWNSKSLFLTPFVQQQLLNSFDSEMLENIGKYHVFFRSCQWSRSRSMKQVKSRGLTEAQNQGDHCILHPSWRLYEAPELHVVAGGCNHAFLPKKTPFKTILFNKDRQIWWQAYLLGRRRSWSGMAKNNIPYPSRKLRVPSGCFFGWCDGWCKRTTSPWHEGHCIRPSAIVCLFFFVGFRGGKCYK